MSLELAHANEEEINKWMARIENALLKRDVVAE